MRSTMPFFFYVDNEMNTVLFSHLSSTTYIIKDVEPIAHYLMRL